MVIFSFIFFLSIFVVIGALSYFKSSGNTDDYLIANRSISPLFTALSAVATLNSGYMFIGMIGYTYLFGLSSIWLMFGWIFGDLIASFLVHRKVRIFSQRRKILSFAGLISSWHGDDFKKARLVAGIIIIIFLQTYAAAQLKAGSKALHVIFGWDYSYGALIGAIIVLIYCFAGGIRASIWTDVAQSFVMMAAMMVLLMVSISNFGGVNIIISDLNNISPQYMRFFSDDISQSFFASSFLFVIGWVFSGFGVAGQPHIMVRFMAMKSSKNIARVRFYYYFFYILFFALTIATALIARLVFTDNSDFDTELALPMMAQKFLPEFLIGLVLAGLFSATISTADLQILSCSAVLSNDLADIKKNKYIVTKLSTLMTTIIALLIALYASSNVFELVLIAWSSLGAVFAPILTLYAFNKKISQNLLIAMMISSLLSVMLWQKLGLSSDFNEMAVGIIISFLTYFTFKKC